MATRLKTRYLILYNLLSLLAWTYLTARVAISAANGRATTRSLLADLRFVSVLQSAALLEVLHAALGLVRSSPATTALQIGGRNLVVWTVMRRFPGVVLGARGYGRVGFVGCLLAWGCSDVIRYAFFAVQLARGRAPCWLKWLRYTAFIPLYPVGFLSEAWLVYIALVEGIHVSQAYQAYLFVGLLAYAPVSYTLYTYMLSQRRRVLAPVRRGRKTRSFG